MTQRVSCTLLLVVAAAFPATAQTEEFAQRFDSAGSPVGDDFQVNTYTTAAQKELAVAVTTAGNFVAVWARHGKSEPGAVGPSPAYEHVNAPCTSFVLKLEGTYSDEADLRIPTARRLQ